MQQQFPSTDSSLNRRRMLGALSATAAGLWMGPRAHAAATAKVLSTQVITPVSAPYLGWPTLIRRSSGQLAVAFSGGREAHVCPFGRVDWITSDDDGRTWSWPRTLLDSDTDDRDAGLLETAKGTLLATTFTSAAWEPILEKMEQQAAGKSVDAERSAKLRRWQGVRHRLPEADRQAELGTWMIRSTDGGRSWSSRFRVPVDTPHGPIQLSDGRLLYAGVTLWKEPRRVGVAVSNDDGVTWSWLAEIPTRDGDDSEHYHELHVVETTEGRLVAQIRNHNKQDHYETLQTHSDDGGQTWTVPYSTGVWGYPTHLLRLRDSRLLMTYGHRRKPVGNLARLSDDGGRSWSEPLTISADGTSTDLGYPSSVELGDGTLLSVWYERLAGSPKAVLRQAHWQLEE